MNIVNINYNYCKSCGICAEFCPKNVFEVQINGGTKINNARACVGCMLCVRLCPDFAVSMEVVK